MCRIIKLKGKECDSIIYNEVLEKTIIEVNELFL